MVISAKPKRLPSLTGIQNVQMVANAEDVDRELRTSSSRGLQLQTVCLLLFLHRTTFPCTFIQLVSSKSTLEDHSFRRKSSNAFKSADKALGSFLHVKELFPNMVRACVWKTNIKQHAVHDRCVMRHWSTRCPF